MKFIVDRQDFHKALAKIEGIISSREIRSVVSNILIETAEDRLILTATDLEIGLKTYVSAQIENTGIIAVPARKLSQTIREFRFDRILLETEDDTRINILDASGKGRARTTLMGSPGEEYPGIPLLPDDRFQSLPGGLALEMIRKTGHSIAEDDARYVFNGLYLVNRESRTAFVGTDGRRLAKVEKEFPQPLPFDQGLILPGKAVRELQKHLSADLEGGIAYDEKDRRLHFRLGDVQLSAKLIEGQFPDYDQVIPKKIEQRLTINRLELENTLRHVSVTAAEPSRQIRLTFSEQGITVLSQTPDVGESQDVINADYSGEEMTIAFNSYYLMDILRVLTSEEITLCFSSPSAPALILDPNDEFFISVIMPMKL